MDNNTMFYHVYPLGFCGTPEKNDFNSAPCGRLEKIYEWTEHLKLMNINALYLGPVFESSAHGYDTADYFYVDRRLGTNDTLKYLIKHLHENGIKVLLDGVFNHVGRNFWAFRDVQQNLSDSKYCSWFQNIDFNNRSPFGDSFSYEGWNGYYDLVKLNLSNPDVRAHLLSAVKMWIEEFNIDGLRLDAADCVDLYFLKELSGFTKSIRNDFWLVGEIIHGDYRKWANDNILDSVTNYECYKGLYSSHNDKNYFEIAYSLNRQFGMNGIYKHLSLYNFADNHDVSRVASLLKEPAHIFPLYILLYTIPGIPSIYYGSEWEVKGVKQNGSDSELRPCLDLLNLQSNGNINLYNTIKKLSSIRINHESLQDGNYNQVFVSARQFAFVRQKHDETSLVIVNSEPVEKIIEPEVALIDGTILYDKLNNNEEFTVRNGKVKIDRLYPNWGRVLINKC
jgi:cyclomaltodextrinase / maltogenic alpha-amylase / neopullulanase